MLFDGCNDNCGWIAGFVSAIAYGTYGVPVKESMKALKKKQQVEPTRISKVLKITTSTIQDNDNDYDDDDSGSITQPTRKQQQQRGRRRQNQHQQHENDSSSSMNSDDDNNDEKDSRIKNNHNNNKHDHHDTEVNPFVFQSYKTVVMFSTCWLVLLLGVKASFTKWGYISGTLWVMGGTCGVVAVRYAGMALAVGTWASIMILINFTWGILIFNEPIHSMTNTVLAFILLAIGLVGMSYYSSVQPVLPNKNKDDKNVSMSPPPKSGSLNIKNSTSTIDMNKEFDSDTNTSSVVLRTRSSGRNQLHRLNSSDKPKDFLGGGSTIVEKGVGSTSDIEVHDNNKAQDNDATNFDEIKSLLSNDNNSISNSKKDESNNETNENVYITVPNVLLPIIGLCIRLLHPKQKKASSTSSITTTTPSINVIIVSKRTVGMGAAILNGFMTGSSLIPMHYAKKDGYGGPNYLISYATGALVCNVSLWISLFIYNYIYYNYYYSKPTTVASTTIKQKDSRDTTIDDHNNNSLETGTTASSESDYEDYDDEDDREKETVTLSSRIHVTIQSMPKLHIRELWLPGTIAGLFLTIAMFSSMIAVSHLGQGIGNSIVQSKILISGMWGIFWYKEINNSRAIYMWFVSASCTIAGIIWLSQERLAATAATAAAAAAALTSNDNGRLHT